MNMSAWEKICRVCSSPAQYDVFAKIPTYLHETSNEFINWQKPINALLEETTGLKVSKDDGLPSSICALCISYLKHASSFRDQVIKNALSLEVIKHLRQQQAARNTEDKDSLLITEGELSSADQRKVDTNVLSNTLRLNGNHKVSKELFQTGIAAPSHDYVMQQMRYLNLLFDKDLNAGLNEISTQPYRESDNLERNRQQSEDLEDYETETTSNDDNDEEGYSTRNMSKGHIFSYTEKNFEEDDVMNSDELRDAINITIPETCKERKCRACFRRFMFEESYEEHMDKCIEYKFLVFIEEMNLLLDIRRKKAVSPHEFIRRMIFSLRKICDFLKVNCDEELLLPELHVVSNTTGNANNIVNDSTSAKPVLQSEIAHDVEDTSDQDFVIPRLDNAFRTEGDNDSDSQVNYRLSKLFLTSESPTNKGTATPISIHNNILYEIERTQNQSTNNLKTTNVEIENSGRLMRPIPMHARLDSQQSPSISPINKTPTGSSVEERLTFLQKLERAMSQTPKQVVEHGPMLATPSISVRKDLMPNTRKVSPSLFSASCNPCNLMFDTLSAFEIHNAVYHNNADKGTVGAGDNCEQHRKRRNSEEERERIIAMFENEDDI